MSTTSTNCLYESQRDYHTTTSSEDFIFRERETQCAAEATSRQGEISAAPSDSSTGRRVYKLIEVGATVTTPSITTAENAWETR